MSPEVLKPKLINEAVGIIHSKLAARHTKGYGIKVPFILLVQLPCEIKFCHVSSQSEYCLWTSRQRSGYLISMAGKNVTLLPHFVFVEVRRSAAR